MQYLRCVKGNWNYLLKDTNSDPLQVLYLFLSNDYSGSGWYESWALSDSDGTGGNISFLDKENGDILITLDPVVFGTDTVFKTSIEQFLAILQRWRTVYKEGWSEIFITQDNMGAVQIEGKNEQEKI